MTQRKFRRRFEQLMVLTVAVFWGQVVSAADAPRVVGTTPADDDQDVDPATTEIRVTFDQPMATNAGYSFVGGGPRFPEVTGSPRWESAIVVVLPVKLKPEHSYWLSINSDRFQRFRGTNGLSAVPHPIEFRTAPGEGMVSLTTEQNRESIRQLREAIEQRYSYRDLGEIDWDQTFSRFEDRMLGANSPAAFGAVAAELLGVARDIHIWVQAGDEVFDFHPRNVQLNVDSELLPRVVPGFRQLNPVVATGRFPNGPAYLMIASWGREHVGNLKAAAEFIDRLSATDSLIIDVRLNSGGDELLARGIAGRFVEAPMLYAKNKYRDTDVDGGFSEVFDRVVSPVSEGRHFPGKVAVLMGPANMSSCEAFLLMMKQVPTATLIGEKSYGSSGNPKPVKLENGVTVFLPSWIAMDADGRSFEGVGIEPDMKVEWRSDAADRDLVVEGAVRVLSE